MKLLQLLFVALLATALHGAELANEDKAYGALHGRIAARIQLWPGLAPHETKADPGKYVFDAKRKVWRRTDVSQPEVIIFRPEKPTAPIFSGDQPNFAASARKCRIALAASSRGAS